MSIYLSDGNKKLKKLAGRLNKIDDTLDPASKNPVQNKTLYNPVTFAEAERQKSKNLFNINAQRFVQGGHTSVSGNTITVEAGGSSEDDAIFGLIPVEENKTYYISVYSNNQRIQFKLYDTNKNLVKQNPSGWVYNQYWEGSYKDFETTDIITQMTIPSGVAYIAFFTAWFGGQTIISNLIISEYSDIEGYQPYNGAITHNGDAPVVFAEAERQKRKNLWYSTKAIDVTTSGLSVKFTPYNQKIVYNGTTDNYSYFTINSDVFLKAGTYTISIPALSGTRTEGVQQAYVYFSVRGGFIALDVDGHFTFTLDQDQYLTEIGFQSNSGITYTNYTFGIQVEEGSVATDYQRYDGSNERVEVIYDMDGGTPLDWGKTGGIYGGDVISGKDFRKYKKLIVYSYSSGNILTTILPLTNLFPGVDSYIGCNVGLSNDTTDLQCIKCSVNGTKTDFEVDAMGYYGTSGFVLKNDTHAYVVFKIEGVY